MKDKPLEKRKLKVTFFIANQKGRHEGVVRPFINFAKGMKEKNEVSFALLRCGSELVDYINMGLGVPVIVSENYKELLTELAKLSPQFVIGDDNLSTLRLLNIVKKKIEKATVIAYVQILYGSHAINRCFHLNFLSLREKIAYRVSRFVPFSFLTRRYIAELDRCDLIVANSKVTATLLQTLYGRDIHGIVYPPVDTEIFKSFPSKKSKEVVLYLGSHAGDTQASFVEEIVKSVLRSGFAVNLFGNIDLALSITNKYPQIVYHKNLKDADLAELYSKSIVTICPQKWEMFGYVQVESMASGTPVLAFDCMGPAETVINGKTGWLAKSKQEFLKILDFILRNGKNDFDKNFTVNYVEENFSIAASLRNLEKVLMAIAND